MDKVTGGHDFTFETTMECQKNTNRYLGLSPLPGCWLVTTRMTWTIFRFGDPNLNRLILPRGSILGGGPHPTNRYYIIQVIHWGASTPLHIGCFLVAVQNGSVDSPRFSSTTQAQWRPANVWTTKTCGDWRVWKGRWFHIGMVLKPYK